MTRSDLRPPEKAMYFWELALAAPALILFVLLTIQRNLLFAKARHGLFDDNVWPLILWALLSGGLLLASKPWKTIRRPGSALRMLGIIGAALALLFFSVALPNWGRYQMTRLEAFHGSMGFSHRSQYMGSGICSDVVDPGVGPYILSDPVLMKHIAQAYGNEIMKSPNSARLLYGALRLSGVGFEEVWGEEASRPFLLACLLSEVNPDFWYDLQWARPLAELPGQTDPLTEDQAKQVVTWYLARLDSLTLEELERIVFLACNMPEAVASEHLDELFITWAKRFKKLETLAVQGLVVRDDIKTLLGTSGKVKVQLAVEGLDPLYSEDKVRSYAVPQMVLGIVKSCGVQVQTVTEGPADVLLSIKATSVPLYDYSQPTYTMETYYETRRIRTGKYSSSGYRVAKQRSVPTGSETKTHFAPVIKVSLKKGAETLEFPESLLYWRDITYDKEQHRYVDAEGESDYGRMWPLGLDQGLYDFAFISRRNEY